MESNLILPFITLIIGLIGAFSKTSKDTEKGKRVTIWGGVIAVLLLGSAGITIISNVQQNKKNISVKEKQEIDNNNQRLLSLLSVSSNFQLANEPYLLLEFNDDLNEKGEPIDSIKSDNIRKFPGFGITGVSYKLELDISNKKHFIDHGNRLVAQQNNSDAINSNYSSSALDKNDNFIFEYEEINSSVNYLWTFKGYRNLTELLFDLQPKHEIGSLTIEKKKGLTKVDFEKISKYLCDEQRWIIRIFLKNSDLENAFLNLSIPVKLIPEYDKGQGRFILIPEPAMIGLPQFDPI